MSMQKAALAAAMLLGLLSVPAYADGDYVATGSVPAGQAPTCGLFNTTFHIKVVGKNVTANDKCTAQLQPDGSFRCSFVPRDNSVVEYSGRISGKATAGTISLVVTLAPPMHGGFSCHATFKGAAS